MWFCDYFKTLFEVHVLVSSSGDTVVMANCQSSGDTVVMANYQSSGDTVVMANCQSSGDTVVMANCQSSGDTVVMANCQGIMWKKSRFVLLSYHWTTTKSSRQLISSRFLSRSSNSLNIPVIYIKLLAPELFFFILAHPVYKMWIIQEPNTLDLLNKLHLEEEKTESIYRV